MQHGVLSNRAVAHPPPPPDPDRAEDLESLHRLRAEILGHGGIPGAPAILAEILGLLDQDRDIHDVARVIELEPGLTAKLLRAANSPFFGQGRSVTSVDRAIMVLGTSLVRNVAIGFTVWDALAAGLPNDSMEALWQHVVTVAMSARHLAAAIGGCDPDEAFTAGLLHDCGQLVLATSRRDEYAAVRSLVARGASACLTERDLIGADHAVVGGWLLESWSLPAPIVAAVGEHHAEEPAPGLPRLVAITSALARIEEIPDDRLDEREGVARARAEALGISADLWADAASAALTNDALRSLVGAGAR